MLPFFTLEFSVSYAGNFVLLLWPHVLVEVWQQATAEGRHSALGQ